MNTVTWAQSKAQILKELQAQIAKVEQQMANHLTRIQNAKTHNGETLIDEKLYARASAQLSDLNGQVEEIQTTFTKYAGGFKGFTPTSFTSGFTPASGGSGSGSGSKSATEKEVSDLEDLRQRYYDVDNALARVNNRLKDNQTLQENADDKLRLRYLEEEIALLGEKKVALENSRNARQQELAELRAQLEARNFAFDSNGQITNQYSRVGYLTDWANSLSGDAKESAKASVKDTVEILKDYTDLLNDEIPSITNEIHELANETATVNEEIEELYREKLENMSDVEGQITDMVTENAQKRIDAEKKALEESLENDRKRIESKKKALEKERNLYNQAYEDENYEYELNEERNKLLDIQAQIDELQFQTDRQSKARLNELLLEYEQQQEAINNKIKEHQNEATNDRFDQEMELLDAELEGRENIYEESVAELETKLEEYLAPQNLTRVVGEAMKSGYVDVLGETVNLNEAMKQMFMDTETGINTLNLQYNDWLETLNSVKGAMYDISTYMTGANLSSVLKMSDIKKAETPTFAFGGITISGNVDSSTMPELERALKKQQETIMKVINQKLGGK